MWHIRNCIINKFICQKLIAFADIKINVCDRSFVINNICDFAIGKADETIVQYGIRSNKAAQGLENIFDFLKEAELRNGTGFMKYQKLLADKICGYEKMVKYASFITIPSYVRALEMDFNLYAG